MNSEVYEIQLKYEYLVC